MKKFPIFIAIGLLALASTVLLPRLGGEDAHAASGPCDPVAPDVTAPEAELIDLVHGWRAQQFGSPAMEPSPPLDWAAQWFAEAMVRNETNGHIDSLGRSFDDRARDCGYDDFWSGGTGEGLAGFGSSNQTYGSTPSEALALMVAGYPQHQNGVTIPPIPGFRPPACIGVGYANNENPGFGEHSHAWVIITAQIGRNQPCPQAVTGQTGTAPPAAETETPTPSPTPSPTPTPTATPTPAPVAEFGATLQIFPGWNLVTLPQGPIDAILDTAAGCYTAVYEQAGGGWRRYAPGAPAYTQTLTFSSGQALWIEGTGACGAIQI